jgi:hypothetical protein
MRVQAWLWAVAAVLTLLLARHQRVTGPTYPLDGRATIGSTSFSYRLERTHGDPASTRSAQLHPGELALRDRSRSHPSRRG